MARSPLAAAAHKDVAICLANKRRKSWYFCLGPVLVNYDCSLFLKESRDVVITMSDSFMERSTVPSVCGRDPHFMLIYQELHNLRAVSTNDFKTAPR